MKKVGYLLLILFAVAIIIGIIAIIAVVPVSQPETGDILFEDEPIANAMREVYQVNGVGGSRFFIESPNIQALQTVFVSDFGISPQNEDNAEAINNALIFCKDNPGTRLVFEKGVYYVSEQLQIYDTKDVCIDGNGAKIVYDNSQGLLSIKNSECLEIKDLTIDWNWANRPLGAIATAVDVKGQNNTLDFVFEIPEYAREDMLYAISQCNDDGTYGEKGTYIESYDGQNPDVIKKVTKISNNTLRVVHNGALSRFGGKKFILRGTAYGGSVFNIGEQSKNITLNGINIYGGSGMGIVIGEMTSHFALQNIFIGPDPEYTDHCISIDCDAVHINDADGYFVIENCDFSKQGDDDVNINSGIGVINDIIDSKTIILESDGSMNTDCGSRVYFRNKNFASIDGCEAEIVSLEILENNRRKIVFKDELPSIIKEGCMLYNADVTGGNYVIRNNYFHEHRARGLLLQTSDGLIENNVFYKITHDAIRIVMDINGVWHEGTGADNIEIRNNKFIQCGYIGTEIIEIGTHLLGKSASSYVFTNIRIIGNEFIDICGNLMAVNNVNNFVFTSNTITLGDCFSKDIGQGRAYFMQYSANIKFSNNNYTDGKLLFTKIPRSDSPIVWLRLIFDVMGGK